MDLAGQWRAAPASDELRRVFFANDLDEVGWVDVAVPGPWAAQAALASERAVLYRTRFDMDPPADVGRRWLTIHGLAQQGDIWLNGAYVGNTDGYFVPHRFEVTHLCQDRTSHLLAIDATVPSEGDPNERTHMMGALLDSTLTGTQSLNPGGLRRTVTIEDSGASAILHFRAVCADANPRRARLALRCVFEHPDGGPITLRTKVSGVEHELEHVAAAAKAPCHVVVRGCHLHHVWWSASDDRSRRQLGCPSSRFVSTCCQARGSKLCSPSSSIMGSRWSHDRSGRSAGRIGSYHEGLPRRLCSRRGRLGLDDIQLGRLARA